MKLQPHQKRWLMPELTRFCKAKGYYVKRCYNIFEFANRISGQRRNCWNSVTNSLANIFLIRAKIYILRPFGFRLRPCILINNRANPTIRGHISKVFDVVPHFFHTRGVFKRCQARPNHRGLYMVPCILGSGNDSAALQALWRPTLLDQWNMVVEVIIHIKSRCS